jgi:FkbH-like protein
MKLNDALKIVGARRDLPVGHRAFLVCGFEPLHLPVFLRAHYQSRFARQTLQLGVGVYGDVIGNLERARCTEATLAWLVLEWGDVDPRLGLRSTGAWSGPARATLLADVTERLERLREAIESLAERMPVIVAAPSVSFPLLGHTPSWQASPLELDLELELARFCSDVARIGRARVLHPGRLATSSPVAARSDARSELAAGFPYTLEHASRLAGGLMELAFPNTPKKGLITDLDDTLWAGIVGEVGAESVSWSQSEHAQVHGLYQLVLRQLADAGVLLGIASKNGPEVVDSALSRSDLLIDKNAFFPVAVSWGPKSLAVSAILRTWNIGADAAVVVDDSPMELEEIRRAHPGITCLEFAPKDARRTLEMLIELRDAFGKPQVLEEDKLRAASIRSSAAFEEQVRSADLDSFVAGLEGIVSFDLRRESDGGRLLELINKTNQFNLNGARLSEGEWMSALREAGHFALGVAYADRFGSLGTIAVVKGRVVPSSGAQGPLLEVTHWVQSCRAFSRRIEDHTLAYLFDFGGVERLHLAYRSTPRNQPFQEFLGRLAIAADSDGVLELGPDQLARVTRELPHRVKLTAKE